MEAALLRRRATAARYARHFAARWRLAVDENELRSLADLALCEAGRAFRPDRKARFSSYLFLHVRRVLHAALRRQIREAVWRSPRRSAIPVENALPFSVLPLSDPERCPEALYARTEARENLLRVMSVLEAREVALLQALYIHDLPLAAAARRLGYSRMHVYTLRERAFAKLHAALQERLAHLGRPRPHNRNRTFLKEDYECRAHRPALCPMAGPSRGP
jgi:RNA polymerase sigma factor (sigma-70 family)